jgi:UDP-3-O-[3-hydroxymyristoyl] N-acetylglucosamine deacetylase
MQRQVTLAREISYSGIGLHSGKNVQMKLGPAAENTGIVFQRNDLPGHNKIQALAEQVTSTLRATTISGEGGATVFTVEHLMAALSMLGIDNCLIEMDAPEPPVMDGSAAGFCGLLQQAGTREQEAERKIFAVPKAFSVYEGDKYVAILPYDGFRVSFTSINKHPLLGTQFYDLDLTRESFLKEIAPARTIGFMNEIAQLQKMGLGLGGSVENVVIYDDTKVLSQLRFENELIRHKILDIIGDLYLLGHLKGHIIAVKSGHALNSKLAKLIHAYRMKEEG